MARNRQHQWQPVEGSDNMVKCEKCGSEVKASRARRGTGPCIWGSADDSPPVPNPDQGLAPINQQSPEAQALIAAAAEAQETIPRDELEEHARIMREVHLCDTCTDHIAECHVRGINPKFGTGVGNDNVYECDGYTPAPPTIDPDNPPDHIKYPGPRLTDPPEHCNVCGEHIAILPLNSRLDMVACNNRGCSLYRERLRLISKPVERGKRKGARS